MRAVRKGVLKAAQLEHIGQCGGSPQCVRYGRNSANYGNLSKIPLQKNSSTSIINLPSFQQIQRLYLA